MNDAYCDCSEHYQKTVSMFVVAVTVAVQTLLSTEDEISSIKSCISPYFIFMNEIAEQVHIAKSVNFSF